VRDDEKEVAEDYRHQRQSAIARRTGFTTKTRREQFQWMEDNKDLVLSIARGTGVAQGDEATALEEYKQALLNTSPGSTFDDINARHILGRVIREIEDACLQHQIPIHSGVVFGIAPELGLRLSQSSVLETQASIIEATIPFLVFCNLVTKTLARTLPQSLVGATDVAVCNQPSEVLARLQRSPDLVTEWTRIFASYAELGWPPPANHVISDIATQAVRIMLIRAVELFALAHEYGHHVMRHGLVDTSERSANSFVEEHQADIFARSASLAIGSRETPPNFYAMSGVGGVIMLGALDLVRRAKAVLKTGSDQTSTGDRHPPFADRIAHIGLLDQHLSLPEQRQGAVIMRQSFVEIIEVIWETVRPNIVKLHEGGVRPIEGASDPGGWLPT
jgi:hypothetical protein